MASLSQPTKPHPELSPSARSCYRRTRPRQTFELGCQSFQPLNIEHEFGSVLPIVVTVLASFVHQNVTEAWLSLVHVDHSLIRLTHRPSLDPRMDVFVDS